MKSMGEKFIQGAGKTLQMAWEDAHRQIMEEQRERERISRMKAELKDEIIAEVFSRIHIIITNEASPEIQKLKRDIYSLIEK